MPKKTTILIVILTIITGVLIFLAVRSDQDQTQDLGKRVTNKPTETPAVVKPFASLSFSKSLIDISKDPAYQTVDIILDTKGQSVAGAQVELSYDPAVLTNVSLTHLVPNQLFGKNPNVLINSIDKTQGRISYALTIPIGDTEKTGLGTIGQLSFTVNKFAKVPSTKIDFLPKSAVTTQKTKSSVLDTTTPMQILLSSPAATISPGR